MLVGGLTMRKLRYLIMISVFPLILYGQVPVATVSDATNISQTSAKLNANINLPNGFTSNYNVKGKIFLTDKVTNVTTEVYSKTFTSSSWGGGYGISKTVSDLTADQEYEYYSTASEANFGTSYSVSETKSFRTLSLDTTAPTFISNYPDKADVDLTSFALKVKINEAGKAYYVVLADGATAPTSTEVKAGTGSGGATAIASGSITLSADTEGSATVSGLTAGTAYDVYLVAEDDESTPNVQSSSTKVEVTTLGPPSFITGYPKTENVTTSSVDLLVKIDKAGKAYYVVLADEAMVPTSSEVKAGTGSGGITAIASSSIVLSADTEARATISGLPAHTEIDIFVVAEDNESTPALQSTPTKVEVTTLNTPPSGFDLFFPYDSTTVMLTRDNFLDTLYFAWDASKDQDGDDIKYRRELSAELDEYIRFIVPKEGDAGRGYAKKTQSAQAYSIQFWFKVNFSGSLSAAQSFLAKAKNTASGPFIGWQIFITSESGNPLLFNANQGYENGGSYLYGPKSSEYNDNEWHSITIVYNQNEDKAYFYFDGSEYSSYENHGSMNLSNDGDFYIGSDRSIDDDSGFINGLIDEVAIWNTVLSADAVTAIGGSPVDVTSNSGDYTSSSNLQGYWRMNEGTGSTVDDASSNSNMGTISGAIWSTDSPLLNEQDYSLSFDGEDDYVSIADDDALDFGQTDSTEMKNYSLSFDGEDDYVEVPHNSIFDFQDSFSIEFWFNHTSDMDERYIITKGRDINSSHRYWGLRSNSDGTLFFEILMEEGGYKTFSINPYFELNKWNHFAISYDGTIISFYTNGVLTSNASLSGNLHNGTYNLSIGYFPHTNLNQYGYFYEGGIDNISIWSSSLTQSQIQSYMATPPSESESALVGYWKFNAGTGNTLYDHSGNGNHGTINGATWSTDSPTPPDLPLPPEGEITNMFRIPYHHIEHYMHEAGVEVISGTWTIIATDGLSDVYASNGPFTLTIDGSELIISGNDLTLETFALHANYPNPFNPTTTISYDLPQRSRVTLDIYNILGERIKTLVNQSQDAGNKIAMWDGTDNLGRQVSAGVYLYQIQAGEFTQTRKMLLLK